MESSSDAWRFGYPWVRVILLGFTIEIEDSRVEATFEQRVFIQTSPR